MMTVALQNLNDDIGAITAFCEFDETASPASLMRRRVVWMSE
jgi:hypothetical protein